MDPRHFLVDTLTFLPPAQMLEGISDEEALTKVGKATNSIAEIVAHIEYWQRWFLDRCKGNGVPMPASAAVGWPAVGAGDWDRVRSLFLEGTLEAAELGGGSRDLSRPLTPEIEFPPLANYTVGDALQHLAIHNGHHLGQVVTLRQVLGLWPPPAGSWTW